MKVMGCGNRGVWDGYGMATTSDRTRYFVCASASRHDEMNEAAMKLLKGIGWAVDCSTK